MNHIEIFITAVEGNKFDVDVFYRAEGLEWQGHDDLSLGNFDKRAAERYVEELKRKDGINYHIDKIKYR